MSEEDAEKLFLQEKPTLALIFIGLTEKTYASVISKEIDSTFAHTTRILSKMEECGLIRFTYEGRIKFVELTEYGMKVEAALKEFRDLLRGSGKAEEENKDHVLLSSSLSGEGRGSTAPGTLEEEFRDPEDVKDTENIKKLDPVNAGILEKIQALHIRIENIYRDAVDRGESSDSVSRKLGPYNRDIKKLRDQIEETGNKGSIIDERVTDALGETLIFLESCLRP